jgi:hypothetical protein
VSLFRKRENNMIYRVKEPFSYTDGNGVPRVMRVGDLVTASHDAYREKWSHLFEPVTEAAERAPAAEVEAATAAPGEKRSVSTVKPPAAEDLEELRAAAEKAGVKVDNRWKADRLRAEIEAAKTTGKGKE